MSDERLLRAQRIIDYVNDVIDGYAGGDMPQISTLLAEAERIVAEVDPQLAQKWFHPDPFEALE